MFRLKTIDSEVGARLRWLVLMKYGTVLAAADALDEYPKTLYRWINGESLPSISVLQVLESHGINSRWVVTGLGCVWSHAPNDGYDFCCGAEAPCPWHLPPDVSSEETLR